MNSTQSTLILKTIVENDYLYRAAATPQLLTSCCCLRIFFVLHCCNSFVIDGSSVAYVLIADFFHSHVGSDFV